MTNRAMPGLVKVGFSTRDPILRAQELGNAGIPHPLVVEYDAHVHNPYEIEQQVHIALDQHREAKEWFRCGVQHAIREIRAIIRDQCIYESSQSQAISNDLGESSAETETPFASKDEGRNIPFQSTDQTDHSCVWEGEGCNRPAVLKHWGDWMCAHHLEAWQNERGPCSYEPLNCTRPVMRKIRENWFCETHARSLSPR